MKFTINITIISLIYISANVKSIKVKDIMVSISEYAAISEEATLYEALLALEETQQRFKGNYHKHKALLVFDKNQNIVGAVVG